MTVSEPLPFKDLRGGNYYERICAEIIERLGPIAQHPDADETMWAVIEEDLVRLFDEMVVSAVVDNDGGAGEDGVFVYLNIMEPFEWERNVRLRDVLIDALRDRIVVDLGEAEAICAKDDWDAMRAMCDPADDDNPRERILKKLLMVFVEEKSR